MLIKNKKHKEKSACNFYFFKFKSSNVVAIVFETLHEKERCVLLAVYQQASKLGKILMKCYDLVVV